jgi:oligosaccharide repeat unit polymerase
MVNALAVSGCLFGALIFYSAYSLDAPFWMIVMYALCAFFFFVQRYFHAGCSVFSFDIIFVGVYTLYALAVPLSTYAQGHMDEVQVYALRLTFDGLVGFVTFYLLFRWTIASGVKPVAPKRGNLWQREAGLIAWVLIITGIAASVIVIQSTVGLVAYIEAGYAGRALLKRFNGPIELGFYFSIIGVILLGVSYWNAGNLRGRRLVLIIAINLAMIGLFTYVGIRRPSYFLVFGLLAAISSSGWRPRLAWVSTILLFTLFLFGTFASYRQILSAQGLGGAFDFIRNNADWKWLDLSTSELGGMFKILVFTLEEWPPEGLYFGKTYLWVIPNLLPRSMGFYTLSLSEIYTLLASTPEFIGIGGNYGFYPVAEGYLNFGPPGPFIQLAVTGAVFGIIVSLLDRHQGNPLAAALMGTLVAWIAFYVRLDSAAIAKTMFYSVAIPFMYAYIVDVTVSLFNRRPMFAVRRHSAE